MSREKLPKNLNLLSKITIANLRSLGKVILESVSPFPEITRLGEKESGVRIQKQETPVDFFLISRLPLLYLSEDL